MNQIIFTGCSFVKGDGLDHGCHDANLWVNIVHKNYPSFNNTELINLGQSGSSNKNILLASIASMLAYPNCKTMFVCWTNCKRLHLNPGVELYDTEVYFENCSIPDIKINPAQCIPGSYMENIRDRLFTLTHHHWDILEMLNYTALLAILANHHNIECFFVNSLIDIDRNYFDYITTSNRVPSDTTSMTQKLLQLETRDDHEYWALYDMIHQQYKNTLGLDVNWLNLDQGFRNYFYVDTGNDNLHPGLKSNRKFADFIIEKLSKMQKQP